MLQFFFFIFTVFIFICAGNHFIFAAALDFVKSHPQDPICLKAFNEACGVGIVITPEQIEDAVSAGS